MEKRVVLITIAFIISGLYGSSAVALTPMGPPKATLQDGQWSFGLELSHSEMDLESFGPITETQLGVPIPSYRKYEIENLESNMFFSRIGIGMWENWDVFLRLGASDAEGDITEVLATGATADQYKGFDGNHGFSWGIGTRAVFYEQGEVTWGGLIQLSWTNPQESDVTDKTDADFTGDIEISLWEVQVAVGPTIDYDTYRIYGGPFLHFVNGDFDLNGSTTDPIIGQILVKGSHDIRENKQLGGYAGAEFYLDDASSIYAEGLFTSDVWGFGLGINWRY